MVGLYTSRVVLQALGVDDYGVYGVVGGVMGLTSFLNTAMAGATSRFITIGIGQGYRKRLRLTFSTALIIHFAIAILVLALGETLGVWFLNNRMVIPEGRMFAANVLLQYSILNVVVGFTQVPYTADIIAHERMGIYAWVELAGTVLKLVFATMLLFIGGDKLIFYGTAMFAIGVLTAVAYRWYCVRNFAESRFVLRISRPIAREMLQFSSFSIYENTACVVGSQSKPILLNLFFGVVSNVGASIAMTVTGSISSLTTNVARAFEPQIVIQYAQGKIATMALMMRRSIVFTLAAYCCFVVPVFIDTHRLLWLWLGTVPEYSVPFIKIIMLTSMAFSVHVNAAAAVRATGRIRTVMFVNGTLYLLSPVVAYVALKAGAAANVVYLAELAAQILVAASSLWFVHREITDFPIGRQVLAVMQCFAAAAVSSGAVWLAMTAIDNACCGFSGPSAVAQFAHIGVVVALSVIAVPATFYWLAFNGDERQFFRTKLRSLGGKLAKPFRKTNAPS